MIISNNNCCLCLSGNLSSYSLVFFRSVANCLSRLPFLWKGCKYFSCHLFSSMQQHAVQLEAEPLFILLSYPISFLLVLVSSSLISVSLDCPLFCSIGLPCETKTTHRPLTPDLSSDESITPATATTTSPNPLELPSEEPTTNTHKGELDSVALSRSRSRHRTATSQTTPHQQRHRANAAKYSPRSRSKSFYKPESSSSLQTLEAARKRIAVRRRQKGPRESRGKPWQAHTTS